MDNKIKKTISKIELTESEKEEVDKINKHEKVTTTTTAKRKSDGKRYEYVKTRYLTKQTAEKRLCQIYGGICTGCGFAWPDYKVLYDYEGATRVERYCSPCWEKWKDKL